MSANARPAASDVTVELRDPALTRPKREDLHIWLVSCADILIRGFTPKISATSKAGRVHGERVAVPCFL
jgi:hypothetical protein